MLSLLRREADGFTQAEIELVGLLGRLVATAAQNLRVYEAERRTVEELRRLSALRADFVSLVSHEVRTPMAAVIGSARTLQQRWRDLIARAARRLPRADRGRDRPARGARRRGARHARGSTPARSATRSSSSTWRRSSRRRSLRSSVGHADVERSRREIPARFPPVRGDPVRLRQVLTNLIDNAVKYSPDGSPVEVRATMPNGDVRIAVIDHGGGIAPEDQRLIFEKFGRVRGTSFKPGSGLGLYIARRSPRRTAARSRSARPPVRARPSRSRCR